MGFARYKNNKLFFVQKTHENRKKTAVYCCPAKIDRRNAKIFL